MKHEAQYRVFTRTDTSIVCINTCGRHSDSLRPGMLADRNPVEVKYSVSVQTGTDTHTDFYTMGIRSCLGVGVKISGREDKNPPLPAPQLRMYWSCISASTLCPCISKSQLTLPTYYTNTGHKRRSH